MTIVDPVHDARALSEPMRAALVRAALQCAAFDSGTAATPLVLGEFSKQGPHPAALRALERRELVKRVRAETFAFGDFPAPEGWCITAMGMQTASVVMGAAVEITLYHHTGARVARDIVARGFRDRFVAGAALNGLGNSQGVWVTRDPGPIHQLDSRGRRRRLRVAQPTTLRATFRSDEVAPWRIGSTADYFVPADVLNRSRWEITEETTP